MDKLLWTLRRRRALSAFLSVLLAVAMVLQGAAPGGIARAYADVAEQEEAAPQEAPSSEAPEGEEDPDEGEADGEGAVDEADPEAEATKAEATDAKEPEAANTQTESEVTEPTETAAEPAAEPQPVKVTLRSDAAKAGGVVKDASGEGEYGGMAYTWSMGWCTIEDADNFTYDENNRLQVHPDTWTVTNGVSMKLELTVNPSSDQSGSIPAGAISFTLPLHLFTGWNGNGVDALDMPADLPKSPNTSTTSVGFSYTVDEENGLIIISNYRDLGATHFSTEIGWKFNPIDVNGGHPIAENADVSGDDWWKAYEDYYNKDFDASFIVGNGSEAQTANASFGLDVMTRVTGVTTAYPRPETNTTSADLPNNFYYSWQDAWGPKPDDADDYFYIAWVVDYGRTSDYKTTQPFKIDLEYIDDENKFTVGDQEFTPVWVGSCTDGDGRAGYADIPGTYYASAWNNVATRDDRTGRLVGSQYNKLDYAASASGYASSGRHFIASRLNRGQADTKFTVLLAYPIEVIGAARAANIDLVNDGLPVYAKFHFKETWDSYYGENEDKHYVKNHLVEAGPAMVKASNSLAPNSFWKQNGGIYESTLGGYQTYLSNGKNVDLRFTADENGNYTNSWYVSFSGTSKTRGDKVLGQHVTIVDDSMFMAPSNAARDNNINNGWNINPKQYLNEGDFEYRGFWVPTFDEYTGAYNSRVGAWTVDTSPSTAYGEYDPIYIYTKTQGADYSLYCKVVKTGKDAYKVYLCDSVGDDNGEEITKTFGHYAFPEGTVGVKVVQDSAQPFMKTDIRIDLGVRILATNHVREIVNGHMDNKVNTFLCNESTCEVSTLEDPTKPYDVKTHEVNAIGRNMFTLNADNVYQYVLKDAYVLPDSDSRQQDAVTIEGKQLGYVTLNGYAIGYVRKSSADDTESPWAPYRLLEGTFYDLLPKGTAIKPGSVTGRNAYVGITAKDWAESGSDVLPTGSSDGGSKLIPEECYWYETKEDVATGQTMLVIHYKLTEPLMDDQDRSREYISFGYILENPTDNIATYGTVTPNTMAFVIGGEHPSTLVTNGVYKYAEQERRARGTARHDDILSYADIAAENPLTAVGWVDMTWNKLVTKQSGFTKTVRPLGTVESAPTATYKSEAEVTTGNGYEYRLGFATSEQNRADHIVLYDVLETGMDGAESSESEKKGTFRKVDVSQIAGKATAGGTATCAPVVYYSTTVTDRNSTNGAYFDLTDTSKWSTEAPADLSAVTAIAIDCSKDTADNDFVLAEEQTLVALLTMDSPTTYVEDEAVNGAVINYREFEGAAPAYDPSQETKLIHSAKVTFTPTEPAIEKSSDPETGTKAEPRVVDGLGNGTIDYTLKVTNSGTYDLNGVTVVDPIPEGLTFDVADVTVALNGAAARPIADLGGAVSVQRDGQKLTFVINKQHPTTYQTDDEGNPVLDGDGKPVVETDRSTTIAIPTKVDALTEAGEKRYENTARLTKANGIDLVGDEYKTETMYHKTGVVEVKVKKAWADGDNRDGIRPTSVTVNLYNGGTDPIDTCKLSEDNGWSHTFGLRPKFDANGKAITYTVDEAKTTVITGTDGPGTYAYGVTGSVAKGFTVTNTHTPERVNVPVKKVWADDGNRDGIRPQSVDVTISGKAGDADAALPSGVQATQTLDANNSWAHTWENLYKYQDGVKIDYTVTETETSVITGTDGPGTYALKVSGSAAKGFTVTNTHTPVRVDVPVKKVWDDANNQDGIRPQNVGVTISGKAGSEDAVLPSGVQATQTLNAGNSWAYTWRNLYKYQGGKEIVYTVAETETEVIAGTDGAGTYKYEVTGDVASGFTVTNTHTPERISIPVKKVWDDNGNQDGARPQSIEVELLADGTSTGQKRTLSEDNNWTDSFTGLLKYKEGEAGKLIVYTVRETKTNVITGTDGARTYADEVTGSIAAGFTVTNKHTPERTKFEGEKVWKDSKYYKDGKPVDGYSRPPVTISLLADGAATGKSVTLDGTADESGEYEAWKYRFERLDKYKDGKEIKYSVTEGDVDGYTASVSGGKVENTPKEGEELNPVTVKVKKVDALTDTGVGLAGAEFTLTPPTDPKSTEASETLVTDENGVATITFSRDGTYTLEEVAAPDGYEKPQTTTYTITVTKGFVRVELRQSVWTWIYNLIAGIGNESGYVSDEDGLGGTLTVADPPATTEVRATKAWQDDDDRDGIRCDVTLDLYESVGGAGATRVDGQSKTIAKGATGDELTVTWDDLPIRRDGQAIVYSVREAESDVVTGTDAVGTYAYEVTGSEGEGFTVTNTHTPELVDVPVTKTWDDGDDTNGVRPASIVVRLLADGGEVDSATIEPDEAGAWAHTFTGLPKYRDHGTEIAYTVEEDPIPGYEAAYDGTDITNTHEVEAVTVNPPIRKTVEGDGAPADAKFTFTMAAQPARSQFPEGMDEMPMPEGSDGQAKTVTVKGPGEYEFGEFGIERPGTYVYTMAEEATGEDGWTYDGATYTVTYEVVARDGHLSATTTIERDGKAYSSDTPEFVNSYEGKHHKRRVPQTGDPTSPLLPWATVAGSALLACGLVLSRRRRRS